jgi:adenosylcobinamide-phosphate synthase
MRDGKILFLALILDLALGDPPNAWHPVAGMGAAIATAKRHAPGRGRLLALLYGAGVALGGAVTLSGVGCWLTWRLARLPQSWRGLAQAGALKMTLSLRGLAVAAGEVQAALDAGDLAEARRLLSWHLVSRDTSALSAAQVAAAAVESVAENASDSLVAPLFYYAVGGLPAALAYRFLNTADAMLGYRDPQHEWLGKAPARLDDLANLVPSRLTAAAFVLASPLVDLDAAGAWRVWRRDAGKTASPNAGHPMSAAAGALGVELEKVGHYCLGAGGRDATPADIRQALRLVAVATALVTVLLMPLTGRRDDRRQA